MHVILTHENADFDAVASQLGAWKLEPDAIPILPQRLNRNVQAYLDRYSDQLPFSQRGEMTRRRVERATMVDSQSVVQVRGMRPTTETRLIDHHPLARDLNPHTTFEGDEVGACTTLFVEKLQAGEHEVTPTEATLMLLGIYEDTGSLTYGSTTARDAQAVAWLLDHGANLDEARGYLYHPLSDAQQDLLNQLTRQAETHTYGPYKVVVATAMAPGQVNEISTLAHRLRDLFEPDALFVLAGIEDRVHLIARSVNDHLDVGEVARRFGGGGHGRAAAALIRDADLRAVHDRLLATLAALAPPAPTIASIMSRGAVRTLPSSATVAEAAELMQLFGHEGVPVLENGQVVGVVTRRDIDRAARHGLGSTPVSVYMRKGPLQVAPGDAIADLQRLMLEYDVGQVPVVEDGRLVGIVTRTDLLRRQAGQLARPSPNAELAQRFEARLTPAALTLIHQASQMAQDLGFELYVVGGFVRDLLLNAPRVATDIDLVVEGEAHALVGALVRAHGGKAVYHRAFGTAHWTPPDPAQPGLDFVTARTEFYTEPSALPTVEQSSIKLDLHRRDFTINTMALALNPDRYGYLLDFYGGQADLSRRLIRVLHSLSLVEDPTRILRAVRLEQRLDFQVEPRTAELIADALPLIERTTGGRIRHELYRILEEPRDVPSRALRRLDELGVLAIIHPDLRWTPAVADRLAAARQVPSCLEEGRDTSSLFPAEVQAAPAHVPAALALALVVYDLDASTVEALALTLKLSNTDTRLLREVITLRALIPRLTAPTLKPSALVALLEPFSDTALCLVRVAETTPLLRERLDLYRERLAHVHPVTTGHDLRDLGLKPGPAYRAILGQLRTARLDGQVQTDADERALAAHLAAEAK